MFSHNFLSIRWIDWGTHYTAYLGQTSLLIGLHTSSGTVP